MPPGVSSSVLCGVVSCDVPVEVEVAVVVAEGVPSGGGRRELLNAVRRINSDRIRSGLVPTLEIARDFRRMNVCGVDGGTKIAAPPPPPASGPPPTPTPLTPPSPPSPGQGPICESSVNRGPTDFFKVRNVFP